MVHQKRPRAVMIRIIGLALFILIGALSEKLTWGFSLSRHKLDETAFTSIGEFPPQLKGQTWKLEAEGGQSYVFMSEDGSHVLKFFKDQPRPWLQLSSYQTLKNKKLRRTLAGYTLIHERCPELSGIVCLSPTTSVPATLIDRLGISHSIDLSSYLFVIQKKAQPLEAPKNAAEKKALLVETSNLIKTLASNHLQDHDPRLHLNLGRLDGKLIVIDPGKIADSPAPSAALPDKYLEFLQ